MTEQTPREMTLELHELEHDTATQSRETIDSDTVERYGELMRNGTKFDPIVVFYDGVRYYRADGWHRTAAADWAGKKSIACHVFEGSKEEAELYAAGANARHGKPMNNADKRKAVGIVLRLRPDWANNAIAKHVGVSDTTVAKLRAEVPTLGTSTDGGSLAEQLKKRVGTDGKSYPASKPAPGGAAQQAAASEQEDNLEDADDDPLIELHAEDYRRWLRTLSTLSSEVKEAAEDPETGHYLRPQITRFTTGIQNLRALLHCCTPAEGCPHCVSGCSKCGQTGFITRDMVDKDAAEKEPTT